ncbi:MAG TPA: ATP-binding protein [Rhizomicrobium sp.]
MTLAEDRVAPGRALSLAFLTAAGFFGLGYGGILLSGHGRMIGLIWLASAFAVCMIVRLSRTRTMDMILLAAAAVGEAGVNLAAGAPPIILFGFGAVSLLEIVAAVIAVRSFGPRRFRDLKIALAFLAAAIIAPVMLGAVLAGGVMFLAGNPSWLADGQHWFAGNLLGFCIVLPIGLVVTVRKFEKLRLKQRWPEAALVFVGVLLLSLYAVRWSHHPMPFLVLPGVLAATVRFRFLGAGLAMLTILTVMLVTDASLNLPHGEFEMRIEVMQSFLVIASLISARASLFLNERDLHLAIIDSKRRKAVRVSRFKSQLLSHVGEEARGPLSAIIGISKMLESGTMPTGRAPEFAHVVAHNGELLQRLYGDLLDLAQAEGGGLAIAPVRVKVGEALRNCVGAIRLDAALGGKPVLVGEIEDGLCVQADPKRLAQIINNLIANSYKYGDNHSPIRVRASKLGDGFGRIEILNAGPGIPLREREMLFQPFGHEAGRLVPGAGIGLSIAKLLAERQGGRIDFESIPGRQTRFWIDLPLAA